MEKVGELFAGVYRIEMKIRGIVSWSEFQVRDLYLWFYTFVMFKCRSLNSKNRMIFEKTLWKKKKEFFIFENKKEHFLEIPLQMKKKYIFVAQEISPPQFP